METGSLWRRPAPEVSEVLRGFVSPILEDPFNLLQKIGGIALFVILIVVRRIHNIHTEDIFVHQAWGANSQGRRSRNSHIRRAASPRSGWDSTVEHS